MPRITDPQGIGDGFSDSKKKLLYYLKVMQQAGLEELAKATKISRMAVHKHLALLQERGLVASVETRGGVGRPRMMYQLTSQSKTIFPRSYSGIATHALDFIERNMGTLIAFHLNSTASAARSQSNLVLSALFIN